MSRFSHAIIEKSMPLMIVLIIVAVSFGGLVEIVPLFFQKSTTEPIAGLKPYAALPLHDGEQVGRWQVALLRLRRGHGVLP